MAFEQWNRSVNEKDKFVEDADGNVAVRVVLVIQMAFNQQDRSKNENEKFVEASDGTPAVRIKIDSITLYAGETVQVKNAIGFVVFEITEDAFDKIDLESEDPPKLRRV